MTPAHLRDCMAVLGWNATALAAQLGCQHELIRRWTLGMTDVPPSVEQWLLMRADAAIPLPVPVGWRTRNGRAEYREYRATG
jgi:hypothetical protein